MTKIMELLKLVYASTMLVLEEIYVLSLYTLGYPVYLWNSWFKKK